MRRRPGLVIAAALSLAAVTMTCSDSPSEASRATAGWLAVSMTTPNGDDGGIMFIVTGGVVDSVRTTFPNILSRAESGTSRRVVVGGNITGGTIAEVWVPDTRKVAQYSATPVEVAARGTFAQRPVTGYTLKLVKTP